MKALIAVRFASRNVGASPAEVRGLWDKYFADIPLSDTRWFEKYETRLVKKGMRIASENRKNGKTFKAVDEKHVGKYVVGIIRNLKLRKRVERIVPPFFVKAEFCFESDYRITAADQGRFAKKPFPAGECLFFGGGSASKKYPKFSANGRTGFMLTAHKSGVLKHSRKSHLFCGRCARTVCRLSAVTRRGTANTDSPSGRPLTARARPMLRKIENAKENVNSNRHADDRHRDRRHGGHDDRRSRSRCRRHHRRGHGGDHGGHRRHVDPPQHEDRRDSSFGGG